MDLSCKKKEILEIINSKNCINACMSGLILNGVIDHIISEINDDIIVCPLSSLAKDGIMTGNEQFVDILENFIGFYERELAPLLFKDLTLELILKNKIPEFLLSKKFRPDFNNGNYFILNFKKIIVENFYSNIIMVRSDKILKIFFDKLDINDSLNLNSEKDVNKLFLLLKEFIWCNYDEIMSMTYIFNDYKNLSEYDKYKYNIHYLILIKNYEEKILYAKKISKDI